ncbi:MAG: RNA polymerase sigma-70 factor [Flavobacteriaceae bacterium]
MSSEKKKEYFSTLFDAHYKKLYHYAHKVLGERHSSEEVVQEAFIKLWENVDTLRKETSTIESYLMVTLKNKIIDLHRKEQVKRRHIDLYKLNRDSEESIDCQWEIMRHVEQIYAGLPQKTLEIFKMSRNDGLSYKEIAEHLDISVKTVELHMSKALQAFREGLKSFF